MIVYFAVTGHMACIIFVVRNRIVIGTYDSALISRINDSFWLGVDGDGRESGKQDVSTARILLSHGGWIPAIGRLGNSVAANSLSDALSPLAREARVGGELGRRGRDCQC